MSDGLARTDVRQDGADCNRCSTKRKGYLSHASGSEGPFPYNAPMSDFFEELKRRKVIRVVVAYIIVGWMLIQIAETTFEPMNLPSWALTLVIVLVVMGLPLAAILAWGFDITPSGIEKTADKPVEVSPDEGPSVAVLPFADMSPNKDNEYFADGLTEELLNVLAKAGGMRVASRTSSFAFKGQNVNIKTVAKELEVAHVVEGSVRKSGNLLRITGQLIEAANDSHLWSETYDRELDDIFAIQDEIATQIARALQVKLAPQALSDSTTVDVRAYDFFLRGRSFFHAFGSKNISNAIEMYKKAIEIDSRYARAWASIAIAKASLAMVFMVEGEERTAAIEDAQAAAARSAEFAPNSADSHLANGMALLVDGRPDESETEFKSAIQIDPHMHEAYYQYARTSYIQGRMDRAAELFEKALEADPDDYRSSLLLIGVYRSLGQPDKLHKTIDRGAVLIEKHLEKHPDDQRALALASGAMQETGNTEKAEFYAERALAVDPDNEQTLYNLACYYAQADQPGKAMDLLEHCVHSKGWMQNDTDLDSLRELPRFKAYVHRLA